MESTNVNIRPRMQITQKYLDGIKKAAKDNKCSEKKFFSYILSLGYSTWKNMSATGIIKLKSKAAKQVKIQTERIDKALDAYNNMRPKNVTLKKYN